MRRHHTEQSTPGFWAACGGSRRRSESLPIDAIASRLFLSSKTVSNNVTVIFDKLQVAGRSKAIVQARDAGLGRSEPATGSRREDV